MAIKPLASPPAQAHPDDVADQLAETLLRSDPTMRLGLAMAESGADALTVMGWSGPTNYTNDTAHITAILRDWQKRFGTRTISLNGHATLTLSVATPPTNHPQALRIAAEHFAFCPDNIWQSATNTLISHAETLVNKNAWTFWWD
jgi:hypothetical protein